MGERVVRELIAAIDAGESVVLATVVDTRRSAPRHAGSKMIVRADGSILGTIGGGEMEARVRIAAIEVLNENRPRLLSYDLIDPSQGDPGVCGGEVHVYLEPYMPSPTIYVIGCGHVGSAVVELAHWMGFRVVAFDDRAELVTEAALPHADARLTGTIRDALRAEPITPETHVVVVTRNVDVDLELLPELLTAGARSVGVMGAARRWKVTADRLRDLGVAEEHLEQVRSPIGLDLRAETPEEIAVSVLGEIVQIRRAGR